MQAAIYMQSRCLKHYLNEVCSTTKSRTAELKLTVTYISERCVQIHINEIPTTSFGQVSVDNPVNTVVPITYLRNLKKYIDTVPNQQVKISILQDGSFIPVFDNPTPIYLPPYNDHI